MAVLAMLCRYSYSFYDTDTTQMSEYIQANLCVILGERIIVSTTNRLAGLQKAVSDSL